MTASADAALEAVRRRARPPALGRPDARIAVHFHPDARTGERTVMAAIAEDGAFRTQFETGTSSGGLTAFTGGDRWRWEHELFDGAYDAGPPSERPRYGALTDEDPAGPAPRFGSAHLLLRPAVLPRTTFAYPDSFLGPVGMGTADRFGAVLDAVVGTPRPADPLDRYIEAHVHGGLPLSDVEAVVLDPSFRGTEIETAARRSGTAVAFHPGFRLAAEHVDADYRGEEAAGLARGLAEHGMLTPRVLGAYRSRQDADPQLAKWVWHLLAAFGRVS